MNPEQRKAIQGHNVVLFDGLCGLCHGTIHFLIRRDPLRRLLYAPLESSLGHELLQRVENRSMPDGIVLIEAALLPGELVTMRSDAAIRILRLLGGAWPLAGWLLAATPRRLRELGYEWIARSRYRMFGAYKICPVPSVAEREMILGVAD